MRVLVTGINGQLGHDVVKELIKRGHESIGVDREEMDLTIPNQIRECIGKSKPEAIIHSSRSYTFTSFISVINYIFFFYENYFPKL